LLKKLSSSPTNNCLSIDIIHHQMHIIVFLTGRFKPTREGRRIQRTKGIIGIISRGLLTGEFVQEDVSSKLADDLREGSEQGLNQLIGEWTK
jgi:hypothetical protein